MDFSKQINKNNRDLIRFAIQQKQFGTRPFYATQELAQSVLTDMDEFPYFRFFRGEYNKPYPVVFEREAGFRPINEGCRPLLPPPAKCEPAYCWQSPCSTTFPCRPNKEIMKLQVDQGIQLCQNRCNIVDRIVPTAP